MAILTILLTQNKIDCTLTAIRRLLVEDGEIPKKKCLFKQFENGSNRNPSRIQSLLEHLMKLMYSLKNDQSGKVKGSAGVPLVAIASVASNRNIIPIWFCAFLSPKYPTVIITETGLAPHKLHLMVCT